MGVVDRDHVVMVGWVLGVDGELVDGELDIDVHGGVGGATGFHGRVLEHDFNVGVGDFCVVECVGVSDESALGDPTCGCC